MSTQRRVKWEDGTVDYDDDRLLCWSGEPLTGVAYEEHPDGRLSSETSFVDGLASGPATEYRPDGQVSATTEHWLGVRHGVTRQYDEAGRQRLEQVDEHGVLTREQAWDERGNLIRDWQIGPADSGYSTLASLRRAYGAGAPEISRPQDASR